MPANRFSVEVEKLDQLCSHIRQLGERFTGLATLTDTSRAQAGSDSPISGSALASFGQTLTDALRSTVTLLEEDRQKLAATAERYRRVDELSSGAADGIATQLRTESRFPSLTARQSDGVRGMLEITAGLDDVIVPAARSVRGAIDRVQVTLRQDARNVERSTNQAASVIGRVDPIAGLSVRLSGAVAAGVIRGADETLKAVSETFGSVSETVSDWSQRADRVLIRPHANAPR